MFIFYAFKSQMAPTKPLCSPSVSDYMWQSKLTTSVQRRIAMVTAMAGRYGYGIADLSLDTCATVRPNHDRRQLHGRIDSNKTFYS